MRIEHLRRFSIFLFALGLILGSCSPFGGSRRPTKYYVLNSLRSEATQTQALADLSDIGIGVGPIRMPMYLDRADVVTRGSLNQVEIAEFAQWAGPLQENLSRVLAENLSVLLSTDKVGVFPFVRRENIDYFVTIYITRFDGMPGDKADLRARWSILDSKRKESYYEMHTVLSHPTESDTTEALIAAKSQTISDLSRDIAKAIQEVSRKHPPPKKKN